MNRGRAIVQLGASLALIAIGAWGLAALVERQPMALQSDVQDPAAISRSCSTMLSAAATADQGELRKQMETWLSTQTAPVILWFDHAGGEKWLLRSAAAPPDSRQPDVISTTEFRIMLNGVESGRVTLGLLRVTPAQARWQETIGHLPEWGVPVAALTGMAVMSLRRGRRGADGFAGQWSHARGRVGQTLNFLSTGILVLDRKGRIAFANEAALRLTGRTVETLRGKDINELGWIEGNPDETRLAYDAGPNPWTLSLSSPDAVVHARTALRDASGERRVFKTSCLGIRAGRKQMGVMVALEDITQLEQHRAELREARDVARHASEAKSTFLANMSHDIRTPINGVMGTLSLLSATGLQSRQRKYVDAATDAASVLLQLINDILDFSKIEAGKLELSPIAFDLEACITSALAIVAPAASAKSLELVLRAEEAHGLRVTGDPDRIRQVLINLASNAVKFTSSGEVEVTVQAESMETNECRIVIEIRDTGIGIPPDRLDRLFKSFSQVDASTSRKYGGTGLGLAICKQLIELMGGTVGVRSTQGVGSVFRVELTLPEEAREPNQMEPEVRHRLVIVEPHRGTAAAFRAACDVAGIECSCAKLEAIESRETVIDAARDLVVIGAGRWDDEARDRVQRVREIVPTVRIVGCVVGDGPADPGVRVEGWIRKPFSASSLLKDLSVLLDPSTPQHDERRTFRQADVADIRILLAEDNPIGQLVTREFLSSMNLSCEVVDRGDLVCGMAESGRFDLILMDCHLPELDGFEATAAIRAMELRLARPRVPILALTASAMAGDREKCLAAGMDGYITKPVQRDTLGESIAKVLGLTFEVSSSSKEHANPAQRPLEEQSMTTPPIDVEQLHSRCLRQESLVAQLLAIFEERTLEDLAALAKAAKSFESVGVQEAAHAIAGGALQVGATELAKLAREIEHESEHGSIPSGEALEAMREEFDRCAEFARTVASR